MSLGIMGISAAFAQAAGRAGKGEPVGKIILNTQFADPTITNISCTGEIKVSSIKNSAPLVETYTDLDEETLSIQADANTQIIISGAEITGFQLDDAVNFTKISAKNTALTSFGCSNNYQLTTLDLSKNNALTQLNCTNNYALTALDVSKNTALTILYCAQCYLLTALDVSENTALTQLSCSSCYQLTAIDLSKNTALTQLSCSSCAKLVSISYPATNSDVSTAIATVITNADAADGTVYTDSEGAYYSTIETAANNKGWTIEQL